MYGSSSHAFHSKIEYALVNAYKNAEFFGYYAFLSGGKTVKESDFSPKR